MKTALRAAMGADAAAERPLLPATAPAQTPAPPSLALFENLPIDIMA